MKTARQMLDEIEAARAAAGAPPLPPPAISKPDRLKLIKDLHERRQAGPEGPEEPAELTPELTPEPPAPEVPGLPSDRVPRGSAAHRLLLEVEASGARPGDAVNPRQFAVAAELTASRASVLASELRSRGLWPYEKVTGSPGSKGKAAHDDDDQGDDEEPADDSPRGPGGRPQGDPAEQLLAAVEAAGVKPGEKANPADFAGAAGVTRSVALAAAWKLRREGRWPYDAQPPQPVAADESPATVAVSVEHLPASESRLIAATSVGAVDPLAAVAEEARASKSFDIFAPDGRARRPADAPSIPRDVVTQYTAKSPGLAAWMINGPPPVPGEPDDDGIAAELAVAGRVHADLMGLPTWAARRAVLALLLDRMPAG